MGTKQHGVINRRTPCIVAVPEALELNTLTTKDCILHVYGRIQGVLSSTECDKLQYIQWQRRRVSGV